MSRLRNGWFVNEDGLVYSIINGSPYQVNASPEMPSVLHVPGYYDSDLNPVDASEATAPE